MSADVTGGAIARPGSSGWSELWRKEDWWAIWIGLGIVLVAYILFANGDSLKWIAVTPAKWSDFGQLGAHFSANILPLLSAQLTPALWVLILATRGLRRRMLGHKPGAVHPVLPAALRHLAADLLARPVGPGEQI